MKGLALILIFILACTPKQDQYKLSYPEEKIKEVLIDVYVISEILDDVDLKEKDSLRNLYITQLEAIHEIDFLAFEKDLEWLQLNPDNYKAIHNAAKDSISAIEKRYKAKKRK